MAFWLLRHENDFFSFFFIFEVILITSIIIYIRTRIRHLMWSRIESEIDVERFVFDWEYILFHDVEHWGTSSHPIPRCWTFRNQFRPRNQFQQFRNSSTLIPSHASEFLPIPGLHKNGISRNSGIRRYNIIDTSLPSHSIIQFRPEFRN